MGSSRGEVEQEGAFEGGGELYGQHVEVCAAEFPGEPVVRRRPGTDPLPADAWALATGLAGELTDADAVVLAVPLYNYGVSQHFKTWVDLVITGAA